MSWTQFTDMLPKWKQTLTVDYVKGNLVNEKDVCGWKKGDGMRQLNPHVYLLKIYSDCLFVHFRPLEMNQSAS